jgi:hypothetical protein
VTLAASERVPVLLALFLPGAALTVHASASARLTAGYASPSS